MISMSGGVARIGWKLEDKPYLSGIMKQIGIGDIVVMKAFFQKGGKQVLRIKGVGIVNDSVIKPMRNLGRCLEVKWLKYDAGGLLNWSTPKRNLMPESNGEPQFTRNTTKRYARKLWSY